MTRSGKLAKQRLSYSTLINPYFPAKPLFDHHLLVIETEKDTKIRLYFRF